MNLDPKGYYSILGVTPVASLAEIKRAYRIGVQKYHPDKNPRKDAVTTFHKIQEAYEVLSDTQARFEYDRSAKPVTPPPFPSQSNQSSYSRNQSAYSRSAQANDYSNYSRGYSQPPPFPNDFRSSSTSSGGQSRHAEPKSPSKDISLTDIVVTIIYIPFAIGGPLFGVIIWLVVIVNILKFLFN